MTETIEKYILKENAANHLHEVIDWEVGLSLEVGQEVWSHGTTFRVVSAHITTAEDEPIPDAFEDVLGDFSVGGCLTTGSVLSPDAGIGLRVVEDNAQIDNFTSTAVGNQIIFRKARGDYVTPTACLSGDCLGAISFRGMRATAWYLGSVLLSSYATENFTDTAMGTEFRVETAPNGGISRLLRLTVGQDGLVTVAQGIYVGGNCSALSFTDRTPAYTGKALEALKKIISKNGEIDHASLPEIAQARSAKGEPERSLGGMISFLVAAAQEVVAEVEAAIAEREGQVEKLTNDLAKVQNALDTSSSNLSDLQAAMRDRVSEIDKLSKRLDKLEGAK